MVTKLDYNEKTLVFWGLGFCKCTCQISETADILDFTHIGSAKDFDDCVDMCHQIDQKAASCTSPTLLGIWKHYRVQIAGGVVAAGLTGLTFLVKRYLNNTKVKVD